MVKSKSSMTGQSSGKASISGAKSFDDIWYYMESKYNVLFEDSTKKLPLESLKVAASGIEAVIQGNPRAEEGISKVTYVPGGGGSLAANDGEGGIILRGVFSDPDRLKLSAKFGGDPREITAHEAGHSIERVLLLDNTSSWPSYVRGWNSHKQATSVISEAARMVQKTPDGIRADGRKKTFDQMVGEVSAYALKSRSEALAECVADYAVNGSSADPLSVAVHEVLKRRLGN